MAIENLKRGSKGDRVKALQHIVGVPADGIFGQLTEIAVKEYQKNNGLAMDGVAGRMTWTAIITNAPTLKTGTKSVYVYAVESILTGMKCDGVYNADERAKVTAYQVAEGLEPDGIVGPLTYGRLFGLTSKGTTITSSASKAVKPVDFKQYDSRWGSILYTQNNNYSQNQTIKSSGCGITSMADIIATWWDSKITPKETAAEAVAKGYRTKNSGTDPGYFKFCAKKYGASKYVAGASIATALSCIADGGLVICNVGPGVWTKNGHYIVWWKCDGTNVYINDPASAASARAKNKLETLKKQTKGYYCFWR